jgi:hypothetical protein
LFAFERQLPLTANVNPIRPETIGSKRKGAGKKNTTNQEREGRKKKQNKNIIHAAFSFFTTHWESAAWPSFFISPFHHQLCDDDDDVCFWLDRLYRRPSDPMATFLS